MRRLEAPCLAAFRRAIYTTGLFLASKVLPQDDFAMSSAQRRYHHDGHDMLPENAQVSGFQAPPDKMIFRHDGR